MTAVTLRWSDSIASIAPALVAAQKQMGAVKADSTAKIDTKSGPGYSYKYADLDSVLSAVRRPLNEHGIASIQSPSTRFEGGGTIVAIDTLLLHESGEWIRGTIEMTSASSDPKALGAVITYARRYAMQAMCGVAPGDDNEANLPAGRQAQQYAPPTVDAEMIAEIRSCAEHLGLDAERLAKGVSMASEGTTDVVENLLPIQGKRLIATLKRMIARAADAAKAPKPDPLEVQYCPGCGAQRAPKDDVEPHAADCELAATSDAAGTK